MGEAARKRREAGQAAARPKPFDPALADQATDCITAARRPFDLSPDASTLYDLIKAVKELQQEFTYVRHAVMRANWNVESMRDDMTALLKFGDIFELRTELHRINERINELPDELYTTIHLAPPTDDAPPLAK